MVVKNEDDIVGYYLDQVGKWADYIIVMNNSSTDKTEDIILGKVKEHNNIIYQERYDRGFRYGLRALLYLDYKHLFSKGDWMVRLDADEIYIDNPRQFLVGAPSNVNFVMSASFQYYYTEKDYEQQINNPQYLDVPPQDRLKYYACNWVEYRCYKIQKDTTCPIGSSMSILVAWPTVNKNMFIRKGYILDTLNIDPLNRLKKELVLGWMFLRKRIYLVMRVII